MEIEALAVGLAGVISLIGVLANLSQIADFLSKVFGFLFKRSGKNGDNYKAAEKKTAIPNNLPSSGGIVGRNRLVKQLRSSINRNTLTLLIGQGGVGKSTLLIETVKRYFTVHRRFSRDQRFDAIVWVSSKDEELTLDKFLNTVARVLDYTGILQIDDVQKKSEDVAQLFLKYNILLLLDNCETITDKGIFDFIERVYDNDRIVVTSRRRMNSSLQHFTLFLDPLSRSDAYELMSRECKSHGLNYTERNSSEVFEALYDVTGGNPLAIKWGIGQADVCSLPLEVVITHLESGEGDIFEKMFESAWSILDEDCRNIMFTLLFFVAPTSRGTLREVGCVERRSYHQALGKLIGLSLIETVNSDLSDAQSLGLHPLTRFFLQKQYDRMQVDGEICGRLLRYYGGYCSYNGTLGTVEAYDSMEQELTNILKIYDWAHKSGVREHLEIALSIANNITVFLWSRGYWSARIDVSEVATDISKTLGDTVHELRHHYYQGIVYFWQGNIIRAKDCLRECKKLFGTCTCKVCCESLTERLEALIGMNGEDWLHSIDMLNGILENLIPDVLPKEQIALFADWRVGGSSGYDAGRVALMQECGITLNRHGEYERALVWLNQSLELAKSISDKEGQAVTYSHMGNAYLGLKDYKSCESVCSIGLEYAYSVKRKSTIARCHQYLCESEYQRIGRIRKTKKHAAQAILWFDKLGMSSELNRMNKIYGE